MALAHSRLTTQGQVSVPAEVRRRLGIRPGSMIEWDEEGGAIVVKRSGRYRSEDIHRALFGSRAPRRRTLKELRDGVRVHARRHARR